MTTRIEKQITIDAPAQAAWDVIADFGNVHRWAPGVTHSYATSPNNNGDGASRHCDIKGFGSVEEDILRWNDGVSFTYDATPLGPIGHSTSVWSVETVGPTRSRVVTSFEYPTRFGPPGALMNRLFMRRKIDRAFDSTLAALKTYVESGVAASAA